MAAGGRPGGQGGPVKRALWLFLCACIVVAVWRGVPHHSERGFMGFLRAESARASVLGHRVSHWIIEVTHGQGGSSGGVNGVSPSVGVTVYKVR